MTDVTSGSLGVNSEGTIAAFGDFNADKHVDIFVLLENGKHFKVIHKLTYTLYR